MRRGRLIFPFSAAVARLDAAATADPGYDPDFKEPVLLGSGPRQRRELPPVRLRCQVEVGAFEALQPLGGGNSPDSRVTLVFHFRDLEREGLVDPKTGAALLKVGDRLVAVYDTRGRLVQAIRTPPGLYATHVEPQGFGIGLARNLLLVTFEDREQGVRAAG